MSLENTPGRGNIWQEKWWRRDHSDTLMDHQHHLLSVRDRHFRAFSAVWHTATIKDTPCVLLFVTLVSRWQMHSCRQTPNASKHLVSPLMPTLAGWHPPVFIPTVVAWKRVGSHSGWYCRPPWETARVIGHLFVVDQYFWTYCIAPCKLFCLRAIQTSNL